MKTKNLIFLILIFFTSCECGDDIILGQFDMLDTTKENIFYSNSSNPIFVDQNGAEVALTSDYNRTTDTRMRIEELCHDSAFDNQWEAYETQTVNQEMTNQLNTCRIRIFLHTTFEPNEDLDSLFVYDTQSISTVFTNEESNTSVGKINIIEGIHQNFPSEEFNNYYNKISPFISDTTICNLNFQDVFYSNNENNPEQVILYSREHGVELVKFDDENYYTLKK